MSVKKHTTKIINSIKLAFTEFLTLPTLIIIGFLVLAFISYLLDKSKISWLQQPRDFLKAHVFANAKATSDLLGAIAAGIIAVTSITITLLLIVVQQTAASMTAQVFDQFLRRKMNQLYFGFFVGLSLFSLITLATVNEPFNPVWGGTLAFVLTVVALYLMVLLMYTTIDQMRPVEIISAIHNHILSARKFQLPMILHTRKASGFKGVFSKEIFSESNGYVTKIDIDGINAVLQESEVVLLVSIGSYVAFGDALARLQTNDQTKMETIANTVQQSIHLDRQRDIVTDAAYGIEQLETIAWTSISTSKSNPAPGLLAIRNLRDILSRWAVENPVEEKDKIQIVYTDTTITKLMNSFETLAIVSSESMQHQNFIEVINSFTIVFERLPTEWQRRTEDITLRILSCMGDHVLTAELEKSLTDLADKIQASGKNETATAIRQANLKLSLSVGKLNSRSTRTSVAQDTI